MTTYFRLLGIAAFMAATGFVGGSAAQPAPLGEGFALLVGSNEGGPGQAPLRYAEADTEKVAQVLTGLGGYPQERVERLQHPSAAQLLAALERVRARVEPLSRRGVQSRFFFYYSGHARADGLNLAADALPLPMLRAAIESLPATLSIVVLDACQSGAFSRPKGAAEAADFSFNSVDRLNTSGIAVIASSNERELSQESEVLHSSYFTHHWLVALRGAGDRNRDGRVTLSEAYQYAYNHTLANTAETAIGEQHATLETNLRGQDDVALTQPSAASARLRVPAGFAGRLLLQALPSWSVLAELDKVAGDPTVLALPAADYAATARHGERAARCTLRLVDGRELELDESKCVALEQDATEAKGETETRGRMERRMREQRHAERRARIALEDAADRGKDERFVLELGFGLGFPDDDTRYVRRLKEFGFSGGDSAGPRFMVDVGYRLLPHLLLGLGYYNLDAEQYVRRRDIEQPFSWTGHALAAYAQVDASFGRRRMFNFFARLGVGASLAWTKLAAVKVSNAFPEQALAVENATAQTEPVLQHFVRPAGFDIMIGRNFGFVIEGRYVLAPAIRNSLAETQNLGGLALMSGLRFRTWE